MTQSSSRKLLIASVASVTLLASAEFVLRLYGFKFAPRDIPLTIWNAAEDQLLDGAESLHDSDPHSLWVPRPHAQIPWAREEHVNARGYRGSELEIRTEGTPFRVAFLGDSSTFGWMVTEEQSFPQRTAAALKIEGVHAESLNAGVIGYSLAQGLARYRELIRPYRPDAVVIGFGAVNDHLNGPGQGSDQSKIKKLEASNHWLGRGMAWCRRSLRVTHFASWLRFQRMGGEPAIRKRLRKAKRLDLKKIEEVGKTSYEGTRRVSLSEYSNLLDQLVNVIKLDGAQAILLSMPRKLSAEERSPVLVEYSTATMIAGERLSVRALDIRALLRSYNDLYDPEREGSADLALFFDHWHPRPRGHQLIADALKPHLLSIARESGHNR